MLLVTRPEAQAQRWVAALQREGIVAAALPLIVIADPSDPQRVRDAWHHIGQLRFVMFVSGNAVQRFFALRPQGAIWPEGLCAGATGPGTAQALRDAGLAEPLIVMPERPTSGEEATRYDSEALWARISGEDWRGSRVLVVRGEQGRDWLAAQWRAAGAEVDFVEAYRRLPPAWSAAERGLLAAALAAPQSHRWLFSSSEALGHLATLAGEQVTWSASRALATHERIAAAAQRMGFGEVHLVGPELASVVAAEQALSRADATDLSHTPSVQSAPLP